MNKNDYIKIKPKGFKKGESIWIDKLTGTKKHVVVPVGKKPSDLAMEINYVYTKK